MSGWARLDDAETKTLNALFHNHSNNVRCIEVNFFQIHTSKLTFQAVILDAMHINNAHAAFNNSNTGVSF